MGGMTMGLDDGFIKPTPSKRYISKFHEYNQPFLARWLNKIEYLGEFVLKGYDSEDMDEIQEWAEMSCCGRWSADHASLSDGPDAFLIKFQTQEDAALFKLAWQDDA